MARRWLNLVHSGPPPSPGGEDASAHERPDREGDSLRREDDSVAVHSNRSTRAIYCTNLSLVTLLIFSCYD